MKSILAGLLVLALGACASGPGAADAISSGERYAAGNPAVEDYVLGEGDQVRVTVYNEPTLSGEFAVSANGTLALPLIGDVRATGRSTSDIAADVRKQLAAGYLRDPQVSIEVTSFRPFFILGEVQAPGQYPYRNGLTAMNAIATAKGFTPRASKQVVYIRRAGEASEQAYRLTPDLKIWPGDTIRLGERYF